MENTNTRVDISNLKKEVTRKRKLEVKKAKETIVLSKTKEVEAFNKILDHLDEASRIAGTSNIPYEVLIEAALFKLVKSGKRKIKEIGKEYISGVDMISNDFNKFIKDNPNLGFDDFLKAHFGSRSTIHKDVEQ